MPTLLIFSLGTLAWLAVLLFIGTRHVLNYDVDVRIAAVAGTGVLLGLGGMLWARLRGQREGTPTGLSGSTTASTAPAATDSPASATTPDATPSASPETPPTAATSGPAQPAAATGDETTAPATSTTPADTTTPAGNTTSADSSRPETQDQP